MKKLNLVFSGSGTNYFLYVGAYKAIHEFLIQTGEYEIGELVGTSGGGIIAALIASGYDDPRELERVVMETLPSEIVDWSWLPFKTFGLIKGKRLRNKIKKLCLPILDEMKYILTLTATNVDLGTSEIFSTITTPEQDTSEAVYATMCFPIVFAPIKIGEYRYIDGGVTNNFPLDLVIKKQDRTIGFTTSSRSFLKPVKSFYKYLFRIIEIFMRELTIEKTEESQAEVVELVYSGETINLLIKENDIKNMIEKGYNLTKSQLKLG